LITIAAQSYLAYEFPGGQHHRENFSSLHPQHFFKTVENYCFVMRCDTDTGNPFGNGETYREPMMVFSTNHFTQDWGKYF
jgi:hypothetical protein